MFDGHKMLDGVEGFALRGIRKKSDVGFLSQHEALRYSMVGNNLKAPNYPVWVIGSASHYTCLFATSERVGAVSALVSRTLFVLSSYSISLNSLLQEKEESDVKMAFVALDPEEKGFIPLELVEVLAKNLGESFFAYLFRNSEMETFLIFCRDRDRGKPTKERVGTIS